MSIFNKKHPRILSREDLLNYCKPLGLEPASFNDLSDEQIVAEVRKNYKKLAVMYHPDKGGNQEKFKQINNAHEGLTAAFTPAIQTVFGISSTFNFSNIKRLSQVRMSEEANCENKLAQRLKPVLDKAYENYQSCQKEAAKAYGESYKSYCEIVVQKNQQRKEVQELLKLYKQNVRYKALYEIQTIDQVKSGNSIIAQESNKLLTDTENLINTQKEQLLNQQKDQVVKLFDGFYEHEKNLHRLQRANDYLKSEFLITRSQIKSTGRLIADFFKNPFSFGYYKNIELKTNLKTLEQTINVNEHQIKNQISIAKEQEAKIESEIKKHEPQKPQTETGWRELKASCRIRSKENWLQLCEIRKFREKLTKHDHEYQTEMATIRETYEAAIKERKPVKIPADRSCLLSLNIFAKCDGQATTQVEPSLPTITYGC
ncbi:MAG: DnaJ domain [Gammaproteobacteria bacterium]|jgi:curved DNA-binding protein CbpA|nr:DnaJ domain [Gammaproteobacteria bacterium]